MAIDTTPTHSPSALVTGATEGIGLETARQLWQRGFRVLVHGRTEAKARAAAAKIGAERLVPVWGDLGDLAQTVKLADQVKAAAPALDVLINNAGVFMKERTESADGFELTFHVNHLAPFLLTAHLLPALKAAKAARVVNVSSMAHGRGRLELDDLMGKRRYEGYAAYANSKLANVYFTHELARRLAGTSITTSALHPGVIDTRLLRTGFGMGGGTVESGARTSVYCATAPELEGVSGRYYSDSREVRAAPHATDEALERALWDASAKLTGAPPVTV
ncbi:MAG: SDR family NAD(P)-dependent oxidoreductase [Myxococcaceae bacterium]